MRTYVLDANALLTLIESKPSTAKVNALIKDALRGHCRVLMSSVNYGEVYGLLLRRKGTTRWCLRIQMVSSYTPLEERGDQFAH